MKTTVVPAQITTVEDKIAGNLNLTQIMLLVATLLTSTAMYVLVPSPMKFSIIKLVLMLIVSTGFVSLAIRIKGKVLLNWIIIIATYSLRPQMYVFNKADVFDRDVIIPETQVRVQNANAKTTQKKAVKQSLTSDLAVLDGILQGNPSMRFAFNRKGGARVIFSKT